MGWVMVVEGQGHACRPALHRRAGLAMAAFAYRALDAGGKARNGVVEAVSVVAARAAVQGQGCYWWK